MSAGRETLQRALGPNLPCFVTSLLTSVATWGHTGALSRAAHKAVVSQKKEGSRKYKYPRGLCPSSGAEGGSVLHTGVSGLGSQGMWERVVLMAWTVPSCRPLPQNLPCGPVRSTAPIWGRRQGELGPWPDTLRVRPFWPCSSLCSPADDAVYQGPFLMRIRVCQAGARCGCPNPPLCPGCAQHRSTPFSGCRVCTPSSAESLNLGG